MIYGSFFDNMQRVVDIQNFKGIAQKVVEWDNEYPKENTLRIMNSNSPNYINYYLKEDTLNIKFAQWKIKDNEDLNHLKSILDTTNSELLNYVLLSTSNNLVFNMLVNKFPYFYGRELYARNCETYLLSSKNKPGLSDLRELQKFPLIYYHTPLDSVVDLSNQVYGPGLEYQFTQKRMDSLGASYYYIVSRMKISCAADNSSAHLVFSISYEDKSKNYWHSAPLQYFLNGKQEQDFYFKQSLPDIKKGATLKVYMWNPKMDSIKVKNLMINLYNYKSQAPSLI